MKTSTKSKNPHSPYSIDPREIASRSIESYAKHARKFNDDDSIPKFDVTCDLPDLEDLNAEGIVDLMEDLKSYSQHLQDFLEENELPKDWSPADIEENEGKYCMDESIYEHAWEYISYSFLNWGYHRMHDDVNVLQFLTHFGGPAGGFWLHSDGTLEYWTAWWSSATTVEVRGENKRQLMEFFRTYSECMDMSYCGADHMFSGEGIDDGILMLGVAERDRDENPDCY